MRGCLEDDAEGLALGALPPSKLVGMNKAGIGSTVRERAREGGSGRRAEGLGTKELEVFSTGAGDEKGRIGSESEASPGGGSVGPFAATRLGLCS